MATFRNIFPFPNIMYYLLLTVLILYSGINLFEANKNSEIVSSKLDDKRLECYNSFKNKVKIKEDSICYNLYRLMGEKERMKKKEGIKEYLTTEGYIN